MVFCEDKAERARQTMHSTAKEAARVTNEAGVERLLWDTTGVRYKVSISLKTGAKVFKSTPRKGAAYKVNDKGLESRT